MTAASVLSRRCYPLTLADLSDVGVRRNLARAFAPRYISIGVASGLMHRFNSDVIA